jgi:hypothetical protein
MERKRKLEIFEDGSAQNNGAGPEDGNETLNPYTGRPYTKRYYDILAGRKGMDYILLLV